MNACQGDSWPVEALRLRTERLGPLPLINHFLERLGLEDLVDRFVPTKDRRVRLPYVHNDSTTIRFCGQYAGARGRSIRGKRGPFITNGHSKDHRPDLKQMLFILTTSDDGGVPVQFRSEDGNCSDSRTHEETWDALCKVTGRVDFLYVADSKLCARDPMMHIDGRGGRFVTVMPRSRKEDEYFREWVQTNEPSWELVVDRPNPRRRSGPRDRWWVFRDELPSHEGWPIIWVYSSLLALKQARTRREHIARAIQELQDLNATLVGSRSRRRTREKVQRRLDEILDKGKVRRYLPVDIVEDEHHKYKQARPGRPGPKTRYVRKTRKFHRIEWQLDEDTIAYDEKSDGIYPLLTNDKELTDAQVLEAHKRQPSIEKRFEQVKTVFEIAPVLLKNEGRIEALFFVYFLTLLVQALIERELRRAMERSGIEELPLYPEERTTKRPTAEQIFRLFSLTQRHTLIHNGEPVRTVEPDLTDLQRQVLQLLGVPVRVYRTGARRRASRHA